MGSEPSSGALATQGGKKDLRNATWEEDTISDTDLPMQDRPERVPAPQNKAHPGQIDPHSPGKEDDYPPTPGGEKSPYETSPEKEHEEGEGELGKD